MVTTGIVTKIRAITSQFSHFQVFDRSTPTYLCRIQPNRTDFFSTNWVTEAQLFSSEFTYWFGSGLGIRVLQRWDSPVNGHTRRGSPLPAWESPDHGPRQPRDWPEAGWIGQIDLFPYFCQLKAVQVRWDEFIDPKISEKSYLSHFHSKTALRKARDNTEVFSILSLNIFNECRQDLQLYVLLIYSGTVNLMFSMKRTL